MTTVADSVKEAVAEGLTPVYVVHANQAAAIERAQALVSLNVTTRAAARGDRRGDARRADGPRLRRHARPPPAQRRRRPPRRDAAPLPPARRAPGRPGPAAGHLRHRHARRRRQHPDPHRADDGAHEVRRQPGAALHRPRVPPARRARRSARASTPTGTCGCRRPSTSSRTPRRCPSAGDDPKARRKATKAKAPEGFVHYDEAAMDRLVDGTARAAHVAVPGHGRPRRQRARRDPTARSR